MKVDTYPELIKRLSRQHNIVLNSFKSFKRVKELSKKRGTGIIKNNLDILNPLHGFGSWYFSRDTDITFLERRGIRDSNLEKLGYSDKLFEYDGEDLLPFLKENILLYDLSGKSKTGNTVTTLEHIYVELDKYALQRRTLSYNLLINKVG